MKIGAENSGPLIRMDAHSRGRGFVTRDDNFAAILNGNDGGPLRYEATAKGPARSFQEMPIVAPVSEPYRSDAPTTARVQNAYRQSDKPITDYANPSHNIVAALVTETRPAPVPLQISGARQPTLMLPLRNVSRLGYSPMAQTDITLAAAYKSDSKAVSPRARVIASSAASTLPFSAHVANAAAGLKITIRAVQLSGDDAHELRADISRLAASFGLSVDQISITSQKRAD